MNMNMNMKGLVFISICLISAYYVPKSFYSLLFDNPWIVEVYRLLLIFIYKTLFSPEAKIQFELSYLSIGPFQWSISYEGKRDIKVKTMEAAKSWVQKKKNEEKITDAALKIERQRINKENAKASKIERQRIGMENAKELITKPEESKIEEADIATGKAQIEGQQSDRRIELCCYNSVSIHSYCCVEYSLYKT
ncbi:hypothetical protein QVD17_42084 [Tagetes erecta]|uniref:Uncharacterized protein n=1 Tax=Tagetes erecta TaxID=13708 RepID=A0AAD8JNI8_TARER|nr:hypothetical protein QVD17_42084 [Tagetes erecta]